MPTKQILNLGRAGIIKDIPSILLPENAFTDGRNVRFNNESVETITGEAMYQVIGTPSTIEYGMHWRKPSIGYNIYFKDGTWDIKNLDNPELVSKMLENNVP